MNKFLSMFLVSMLVMSGICFADAQNEAETRPRVLVMPASTSMATPVVTGWVAASSANQSCVTTCGIATPIFAIDAATALFVSTSSATADSCVCSGAIS